jgi:hypothetical protein
MADKIIPEIDLKISVYVEPLDNTHMSNYEFECAFYIQHQSKKRFLLKKENMHKINDDNYLAIIPGKVTAQFGWGPLMMELTAHIPDGDFENGFRTEKAITRCEGVIIG